MGARGIFVSVEGIDGSGKSTQAARLAERLRSEGYEATETREPGGSPGAEEIREVLLRGGNDWSGMAETLLFSAARADHVQRVIRPALAAGRIVVCDRFADSTRAYQGGTPAVASLLETVHRAAIGIEPDLTILFDLDPAVAAGRRSARPRPSDRFENRGDGFQRVLRQRFLAIAAAAAGRVQVVDADASPDDVAAEVWSLVAPILPRGLPRGLA